MRHLTVTLAAVAALAALTPTPALGPNEQAERSGAASIVRSPSEAAPGSTSLDPVTFADLASGIGLVRDFNCAGKPTAEGTGFLVGTSVLMTARHVIHGACKVKVFIDGHWIRVKSSISWFTRGRGDVDTADVTTMKLATDSDGHVFAIRTWSAGVGKNVAALGHPLGNRISLNQGTVVQKGHIGTVPMLAVRMLAAEGGSGSPIVDDKGKVVGILQIGLGGKDIFGQRTSGAILGIDLPSWWPTAKRNLCKVYRYGGITGCPSRPSTNPSPAPTPPPPAAGLGLTSAWLSLQNGGSKIYSIASKATVYLNLTYNHNAPSGETHTIDTTVLRPDGTVFSTFTFNVEPGYGGVGIYTTLGSDTLLPMAGTWHFQYSLDHGVQTGDETLHVERLNPISVTVSPYIAQWSLLQEISRNDVLSAALFAPNGTRASQSTFSYAATVTSGSFFYYASSYFYGSGTWTVRFYLNGGEIWSGTFQQ